MLKKAQEYRFSLLGFTLLSFYLFPSLLRPYFDSSVVLGTFLALISLASVNLMMRPQNKIYFAIVSILSPILIFGGKYVSVSWLDYEMVVFGTFLLFFSMVAYHLFTQMSRIKVFDIHVKMYLFEEKM